MVNKKRNSLGFAVTFLTITFAIGYVYKYLPLVLPDAYLGKEYTIYLLRVVQILLVLGVSVPAWIWSYKASKAMTSLVWLMWLGLLVYLPALLFEENQYLFPTDCEKGPLIRVTSCSGVDPGGFGGATFLAKGVPDLSVCSAFRSGGDWTECSDGSGEKCFYRTRDLGDGWWVRQESRFSHDCKSGSYEQRELRNDERKLLTDKRGR